MAYALAVSVLDGAALINQFSPKRIAADDVWALIPRIKAHHEPEFDKAGPLGRGATRLIVRFTDGTDEESLIKVSRGIASPLSGEATLAKFRVLTEDVIDESRRAQIEDGVLGLETLSDVGRLITALADPVKPIFT